MTPNIPVLSSPIELFRLIAANAVEIDSPVWGRMPRHPLTLRNTEFKQSMYKLIQSWPKKFVLGCVISPLRQQAESRNLGQTFLANSVQ